MMMTTIITQSLGEVYPNLLPVLSPDKWEGLQDRASSPFMLKKYVSNLDDMAPSPRQPLNRQGC